MRLINDKRGISHIEIMISFVIFLGFLIFLLTFLNPFHSKLPNSLIGWVESEMVEEMEETSYSISITLIKDIESNCFRLEDIPHFKECEVVVRDESNSILKAENYGGVLTIEKSGEFYMAYCSDILSENRGLSGCVSLFLEDYELGVLNEKKVLSREKIQKLVDDYYKNYELTKDRFNIPSTMDYAFILTESSNRYEAVKEQKKTSDQIAKTIKVEVLNEDATVEQGSLTIMIW